MTFPRVEVDRETLAAYLYLSDGVVARTRQFGGDVNVDFTATGELVGVEILGATLDAFMSVAETVDVLRDPETVKVLRHSEADIAAGNVVTAEEFRAWWLVERRIRSEDR